MSVLKCTHSYHTVCINHGRMVYCRVESGIHWFIMVESGWYENGIFVPDDLVRVAFSYVPTSTYAYISDKYAVGHGTFYNRGDESSLSTLWGYIPFVITQSFVVDTGKLAETYVPIKEKCVSHWHFKHIPTLRLYNIVSIYPWLGITDCIGYSNAHFDSVQYGRQSV